MKQFKILAAITAILAMSPLAALAAVPAAGTPTPPAGTRPPGVTPDGATVPAPGSPPIAVATRPAGNPTVPAAVTPALTPPTAQATPAPQPPAPAPAPGAPSDLSYEDAKRLLPSFEVGKEGSDPSSQARLFGVAPQSCFNLGILVSNTDNDPGLSGAAGKFGFRINVTAAAKACLEAQIGQPLSCGIAGNCIRLSELPQATLSLAGKPDGEIVILHENPSGDRVRMIADSINPAIKFESAATSAARQAALVRAARENDIKAYRWQIQNCRKDDDQLVVARTALQGLLSLGEIHGSELESITKALDKAALDVLLKQAVHGKLEDSFELREKLQAWATNHPEDAEKIAKAYFDLAQRYATADQDPENPGAGIDMAQEIIAEAKTLDLSKTSQKRLSSYQTELKLMKNEQLASGGWQNNMALQASLQALIKGKGGLEDQAKSACKKFPQALAQMGLQSQQMFTFTTSATSTPSQEEAIACSNASGALTRAYGVRTAGMQADQASMQARQQNGQGGTGFGQGPGAQPGFGGQPLGTNGGFGQNSNLPQQNGFGTAPAGANGFGNSNPGFGQQGGGFGWGSTTAGNVGFGGGNFYGSPNSGQNGSGAGFGNGFNGGNGFNSTGRF